MSQLDLLLDQYKETFTKKLKRKDYDEDLLRAIAKSLGPSLYNKDAAKVACSQKSEREKIKKSFLIKKLGLKDSPELEEAILEVCATMGKSNRSKYRTVFYYLLVERFEKQSIFLSTTKSKSTAAKGSTATKAKAAGTAATAKSSATATNAGATKKTESAKAKATDTAGSKATSGAKKVDGKGQTKKEDMNKKTTTTSEQIIERHAVFAAMGGLVPIPFLDLVSISAVQYKMIKKLAEKHDHVTFDESKAESLVAAIMGGLTSFELGIFARILFKGIPIVGPIIGGGAMSGFAFFSTKTIGHIFEEHFSSGGTLSVEDITIEKMKQTFKTGFDTFKSEQA